MGATRMNTQTFVTVYYAFILACVASLIALPADEEDAEYKAEPEVEVSPEAEQGDAEVTEPDYEFEDEPEEEEPKKEEPVKEEVKKEEPVKEESEKEEPVKEEPKKEEVPDAEEPKGHFVPEGMVLPEDDEDVDLTPRMKIPEFTGTISLAETARQVNEKLKEKEKKAAERKEKAASAKISRKDDFDIDLKPGDDFDI
jgi:hypothetical protein